MRESKVEKFTRQAVIDRGGLLLKFVSPGWAGAPDRILLVGDGRVVFVEFKAPGKKLRPLQQKRQRQIVGRLCEHRTVDSIEGAVALIKELFGA